MLKMHEAVAVANHLNAQAAETGQQGADGEVLKFRAWNTAKDGRVKNGWIVEAITMVERQNMMSGKTFWIDIRTPAYLDPSRESYWSM